ncbi:toxofilin [Toxoplasma gondii VEG]|uniref:Toxofilin n=3 Tax=Toxoplasma gondii TaxID=5811 RepID=B9QND9_TOXGV|nr:toxofilin [Toxoplasma gondii VEG]KFG44314.1 toxofilin [Toxoplasma gondii FOU]PUA86489.1 toxofilin [Toxoplasma gondii TgCATBr9]CEL77005.1 TPA: toxofilin [Toxoplasma gondii VEG]
MAQYKSRPLAAFLLLITVGSLLTASESVQLSEGMKRLSIRGKSPSPKRGRFETGDEGPSTMSPTVAARQQELGLLRPEERLIAGQAKQAALQTAHQLGAFVLTPEQARAALLDEILRATQNLNLGKYENLNTDQQQAYEQVKKDLLEMSPETKSLLIENRKKEQGLLERAKKLFMKRNFHVSRQAAMAGRFLNDHRNANGELEQGAVKQAIQKANEQYNPTEEEKNYNEQQQEAKLKKVGALPPM